MFTRQLSFSPVKQYLVLLVALALLLTQCQKKDAGPTQPEDQLPAATQTGAGTIGYLLNGQPWTPSGHVGTPNFTLDYDPSYLGGALQVKCYRYPSSGILQSLTFGAARVTRVGTYVFTNSGDNGVAYSDGSKTTPCNRFNNLYPNTYQSGSLTLTRFDLSAHIISGTFSFKLYQPGCDTLKITQGRFDYTL